MGRPKSTVCPNLFAKDAMSLILHGPAHRPWGLRAGDGVEEALSGARWKPKVPRVQGLPVAPASSGQEGVERVEVGRASDLGFCKRPRNRKGPRKRPRKRSAPGSV